METGKLTPKSNDTVCARRYTGSFGQPSGHGSILEAIVRRDGRLVLTVKTNLGDMWTAELSNEQRKDFVAWAAPYEPVLWEDIDPTSL
jgi:hypothetical protein